MTEQEKNAEKLAEAKKIFAMIEANNALDFIIIAQDEDKMGLSGTVAATRDTIAHAAEILLMHLQPRELSMVMLRVYAQKDIADDEDELADDDRVEAVEEEGAK